MDCEYPLKMKDCINAQAFAYLRKNGLLQEDDESSENMCGLDWDWKMNV